MITEGDSMDEALENVADAFAAVVELYEDQGRSLPQNTRILDANSPVWVETSIHLVKYREVVRKLSVLGCQERVRKGAVPIGNGFILFLNKPLLFRIGQSRSEIGDDSCSSSTVTNRLATLLGCLACRSWQSGRVGSNAGEKSGEMTGPVVGAIPERGLRLPAGTAAATGVGLEVGDSLAPAATGSAGRGRCG